MSTPKLDELRVKIDACDESIVKMLNERAALVLQVKETKTRDSIDVYSPLREKQIFERVKLLAEAGDFPKGAVERIFRSIVSATRSLVGELSVSYVGPEGTPAHEAALRQFGESVHCVAETKVEDVLSAVASGEAHYGVVLGRTEEAGFVTKTLDLLASSGLQIIGENYVRGRSLLSEAERADLQFYVVGQKCPPPTGNDKTTLILTLLERAGVLREVLQPFSDRGVTLLSLESRAHRDRPTEYSFYVDLPGHKDDAAVKPLLSEVASHCRSFSILGSYPLGVK